MVSKRNKKSEITTEISDKDLAVKIAQMAEELFAEDVKVIDVQKMSNVVDYLVLMTGNSSTQIKSLANKLDKYVRIIRDRIGLEGRVEDTDWILVDYGTVVLHIFDSTARLYYNLDELWNGDLVVWEEIKQKKVTE